MLSCIYWGALFGGAITSVLFNIPGEPWSVATTFDGHPMAQQGRAGEALTAAFTSSFVGALFAVVVITLLAPLVAPLAGCVVAPYGTYYRPSSSVPGASFRRAWCQGQAVPTTQIELPLGDGLTLSARAERDYIERDRPELPLRVVLTVPATGARITVRRSLSLRDS